MSRRRKRKSSSRRAKWLAGTALASVFFAIATFLGGTLWAKRYIRSDAFRAFLSREVSTKLHVEGKFTPFTWTGASVYTDSFKAQGTPAGPLTSLHAEGLRATVDFSSFRRDAWEIEAIDIHRLTLNAGGKSQGQEHTLGTPEPKKPTFWSRWLPQSVKIGGITLTETLFTFGTDAPLKGTQMRFQLSPLPSDDGWNLHGEGGQLSLHSDWEPWQLQSLHGRLRDKTLYLTDAAFDLPKKAILSMNGDLRFDLGEAELELRLEGLPAEEILQADWRQRMLGTFSGEMSLNGKYEAGLAAMETKGKVRLTDGTLTALPVLDRIADYTRTERFRRLVLSEAAATFTKEGDDVRFRQIRLHADGLMRVTGELTVAHPLDSSSPRALNGTFEIGVVKEVLRWLPGAEKQVFTSARDGYLWTTMNVQGTLEALEEDLSPRLQEAALAAAAALPSQALDLGTGFLEKTVRTLSGDEAGKQLENTVDSLRDTAHSLIKEGLGFAPMLTK